VQSTRNLSGPGVPGVAGGTVCCDLAGHAAFQATPEMLPAVRLKPGPLTGEPFPPSFLKHADEQTVVGLAAVLRAIHAHGLDASCFTDWGILGAPRFLGRNALAVALQRYQLEGAWGISPHLIPHRSLHSVSGSVSQALAIHGPNFGVSGGLHAADEALLVAATLLAGDRVPGVWVVLTGYDPEPIPEQPDGAGGSRPATPSVCRALALALVMARPGSRQLKLHIGPAADEAEGEAQPFFFESLLEALGTSAPAGSWRLHCGGWVELKRSGAGAEN
jgi:hypothetical protein